MTKCQDEERTVTVESNKVKEESLKVAPGKKCWRKIFLQTIKITGELLFLFLLKQLLIVFKLSKCDFFSSETLVFPIAVLFAIVAYAGVAIFFYNNDG